MNLYKAETAKFKDKLNSKKTSVINHTKQLKAEKRRMAKASRREGKETDNK